MASGSPSSRVRIPDTVYEDKRITLSGLITCAAMLAFLDPNKQSETIIVSRGNLAKTSGRAIRSIDAGLAELHQLRILQRLTRNAISAQAPRPEGYRYQFLIPISNPKRYAYFPVCLFRQCKGSALGIMLALHYFADGSSGICFPSINTLARYSRVTERSVYKGLSLLSMNGLVEVTKPETDQGAHARRSNTYRIAPPSPRSHVSDTSRHRHNECLHASRSKSHLAATKADFTEADREYTPGLISSLDLLSSKLTTCLEGASR